MNSTEEKFESFLEEEHLKQEYLNELILVFDEILLKVFNRDIKCFISNEGYIEFKTTLNMGIKKRGQVDELIQQCRFNNWVLVVRYSENRALFRNGMFEDDFKIYKRSKHLRNLYENI